MPFSVRTVASCGTQERQAQSIVPLIERCLWKGERMLITKRIGYYGISWLKPFGLLRESEAMGFFGLSERHFL